MRTENGVGTSGIAKLPECEFAAGAAAVRGGRGPLGASEGRRASVGAVPAVRRARRLRQPVPDAAALRPLADGREPVRAGQPDGIKCNQRSELALAQ